MLGVWGQPAEKAPHVSGTLEPGEWRVLRLGRAQPRSGAEGWVVEPIWGRRGTDGSGGWRKGHEESGFGRVMINVLASAPTKGKGHLSLWGTTLITQNLVLGLSRAQDRSSTTGVTWTVLGMQNLRPTPDLLSQNLCYYKIPRRSGNTLKCQEHS